MASFLQSLFGGKKQPFVSNSQTVKLEKDPNDETKEILRFGDGKDDYFPVKGDKEDKEALREILSKVIESPTQLKKIKDLPLEDRPTLIRDHSGKIGGEDGMQVSGYCSGLVISITPSTGTGYTAAGVFCHEFQHQYQFKRGDGLRRSGMMLSEAILNDRINEAAADTANYQYLYEMKDKNPQAKRAFESEKLVCPGLKTYAAAKDAGKSELDCMIAGMEGYASSYETANAYAKGYHPDAKEQDAISADEYSDSVRTLLQQREKRVYGKNMQGEKLDDVAAFKAHTVGMTTESLDEIKEVGLHGKLRSPEFNYVTPTVARAITRWADKLKKMGEKTSENPENLWVRTAYGITDNRTRGGLAGLMFKAKTKFLSATQKLKKIVKGDEKLGAAKMAHSGGKYDLVTSSDKDGAVIGKLHYQAEYGQEKEYEARKVIGQKETEKRNKKAQQMLAIMMKNPANRKKVEQLTAAGQEITLAFQQGAGMGIISAKKGMIILDPSKKPKDLAKDFEKFFPRMAENRLKEAQTQTAAPQQQTAPEAAQAKPIEKQPENHIASKVMEQLTAAAKTVEPKQEINGEALLKMVDRLAFRASKTPKSDTYYKPTEQEAQIARQLAQLSKNAVKLAGVDYRSVQAKPIRAKALADYAKTPDGKSGVVKLMQAYGNMKAFEKPREKQPLMQTLQARTTPQAQPQQPVKQAAVAKTQESQGR